MILCISVVCCDLSILISNFIDLIFLPLFLDESGLRLSILFILSKNQLLALLIFAMVFFVSIAFISALIFKISFLLLTLGFFISSFSSCFRCRVRLFIWLFSCFLRCACMLWTFPLALLLQWPYLCVLQACTPSYTFQNQVIYQYWSTFP